MTTVPAEGPSAESFDRSLPRRPSREPDGSGACWQPLRLASDPVPQHHPFPFGDS